MTDWNSTVDAADSLETATSLPAPVVRTTRRSALRPAPSRRQLYADAREQARQVRGRNAFVWQGRVLPIGVPLAVAASLVAWQRRRSTRDTLGVLAGVGIASYLEARVEWSLRRRAYRRRRDQD
jgi:hypothetical protein